jgi:AbrB family looped-hinge helix DNA binding protein
VKTRVSTKGQIVVPSEIREQDGIEPGQEFEIERIERGVYKLVRRPGRSRGVVDWLAACPAKGFFVAIESESTDTIG